MKKKILVITMLLLITCGCGKVSTLKNGEDAVVSFKDGSKISVNDLYDKVKDKYGVSTLIDMIDKELLYKEYKDNVKDAEKNADSTVESLKKNYNSEEELLNAIQSYYGYQTIDEFKSYVELNYLRDLVTTDYAKKQITNKQIKAYYESDVVGDIEASHILIVPETNDKMTDKQKTAAEEKALKEAKEVIEKLNKGEDFTALAKKYSDDDDTKNKGGALGAFNKGDMQAEFEKAAYDLKINEYTKTPVKTTYGYHIIKKTKESAKKSLDKVKEDIKKTLADKLKETNSTISITAMDELRKSKGLNIEDSELSQNYNKYMNSLYSYYATSTTTTTK